MNKENELKYNKQRCCKLIMMTVYLQGIYKSRSFHVYLLCLQPGDKQLSLALSIR